MRRLAATATALVLLIVSGGSTRARTPMPRERKSPPAQISVVTVNAKQARVLGLKRFLEMFELGRALRQRPEAFDGGSRGAVAIPDLVLVQEIRPSNLEIFERLLRQRFSSKFRIAGESNMAAAIVYNEATISLVDLRTWGDVCTSPQTPTDGRGVRDYPIAHFTENGTGIRFTVAGMHLAKSYQSSGQRDCHRRNVDMLRSQLSLETGPVIIGGDFNRRPVEVHHECDPEERSSALPWWQSMTSPQDAGRPYADAVWLTHRLRGRSLRKEWTHEQRAKSLLCNGEDEHFRRSRIDYLFAAGVTIAEAHTDHPGWGGRVPGSRHRGNFKYSDHRFVWGRFVIGGPPRPRTPALSAGPGGVIHVTWEPVEGAVDYVVYRARAGRAFSRIGVVAAESASFDDHQTEHGRLYRYAVAARGAGRAQGRESRASSIRVDRIGPRPVRVVPSSGATRVGPGTHVVAYFDERVARSSVGDRTVRLFLGRKRISGAVTQPAPRVLKLNPRARLRAGRTYRVVIDGITDAIGNRGRRVAWQFTTKRRR